MGQTSFRKESMSSDKKILANIEKALGYLDESLSEVIASKDEAYKIGKLGRAIGMLREFQAPIFDRNPELKPLPDWHDMEEPKLTEEQKQLVAKISDVDLQKIDAKLLSLVSHQYQKVAKIVLIFMQESGLASQGIPDLFYAQRIEKLALDGKIHYEGNLNFMQYCEVKRNET